MKALPMNSFCFFARSHFKNVSEHGYVQYPPFHLPPFILSSCKRTLALESSYYYVPPASESKPSTNSESMTSSIREQFTDVPVVVGMEKVIRHFFDYLPLSTVTCPMQYNYSFLFDHPSMSNTA